MCELPLVGELYRFNNAHVINPSVLLARYGRIVILKRYGWVDEELEICHKVGLCHDEIFTVLKVLDKTRVLSEESGTWNTIIKILKMDGVVMYVGVSDTELVHITENT